MKTKNILTGLISTIALGIILSLNANAQVSNQNIWKMMNSNITPVVSSWTLGNGTIPIGTSTITNLTVTGTCIGCTGTTSATTATAPLVWNSSTANMSLPSASSTANGYMDFTSYLRIHDVVSTSLLTGGTISTTSPTVFYIATTTMKFVDNYTDVLNPTDTTVVCPELTGQTVTNIATANVTYLVYDSSCTLYQQTGQISGASLRDRVEFGVITHPNHSTIGTIDDRTITPISSISSTIADLSQALGPVNVSGNIYSANGANLAINKSVGSTFAVNLNYTNSKKNPHITTDSACTTCRLILEWRNGTGGVTSTSTTGLIPSLYDDGTGGALQPAGTVNSGQWTIQKIYYSAATNQNVIEFGQAKYGSEASAEAAIHNATIRLAVNTLSFRGWWIVRGGSTSLSADGVFVPAGLLSDTSTGAGTGSSITTLQGAYENSTQPQVVTDATRGAVQIKRGSGADTDNVFDILNGAGSIVANFIGNGNLGIGSSTPNYPLSIKANSSNVVLGSENYAGTHNFTLGQMGGTQNLYLKIDGSLTHSFGSDAINGGDIRTNRYYGYTQPQSYMDMTTGNNITFTANNTTALTLSSTAVTTPLSMTSNGSYTATNGTSASTVYGQTSVMNGYVGQTMTIGGSNSITFQTYAGSWGTKMTLANDGSLGIGTTTPDDMLEVRSNSASKASLAIYNNTGTNTFKVTDAGYVGIGTSTPQVLLSVASSTATTTVLIGGAGFPGNIIMRDTPSGATCTQITTSAGIITGTVVTCP